MDFHMVDLKGDRTKHKRPPNEILIQFNNSCKGNEEILVTVEPQSHGNVKNEADHPKL